MRSIAQTIGDGLGLPVRGVTQEEAMGLFEGIMGMIVGADNPTSSAITRRTLDWTPREADLLTDIKTSYLA